MRKLLTTLHLWVLRAYDRLTAKEVTLPLHALFAQHETPDEALFTVAARVLDIRRYLATGQADFPYQNAISTCLWGARHDAALGNSRFKALIDSYSQHGYDGRSTVVVDQRLNLIDGTHRVAMNFVTGAYEIRARVVKRNSPKSRTAAWFYAQPSLSAQTLQEIQATFEEMKSALAEEQH